MCAALPDQDALDVSPTGWAGLTLASINGKMVLEITSAVDPVDAGPIAADAFLQGAANRLPQPGCLGCGYGRRIGQWMEFGTVQGFIGVDVAQTGNEMLIEQKRLELPVTMLEFLVEPIRGEFIGKRFGSQA